MASLKVNKALYVITAGVVVALFGMFTLSHKAQDTSVAVVESAGDFMTRAPTPKTADADTTSDTINAIGGHLENVEKKMVTSHQRAEVLELERKEAIAENKKIAARYESKLNEFTENVEGKHQASLELLLKKLDEVIVSNEQNKNAPSGKSIVVPPTPLLNPADRDLSYGYDRGAFVPGDHLLDVFWIEPLDDSLAARSGQTLPSTVNTTPETSSLKDGMPTALLSPLENNRNRVKEFIDKKRDLPTIKPVNNRPNTVRRQITLTPLEVDDT